MYIIEIKTKAAMCFKTPNSFYFLIDGLLAINLNRIIRNENQTFDIKDLSSTTRNIKNIINNANIVEKIIVHNISTEIDHLEEHPTNLYKQKKILNLIYSKTTKNPNIYRSENNASEINITVISISGAGQFDKITELPIDVTLNNISNSLADIKVVYNAENQSRLIHVETRRTFSGVNDPNFQKLLKETLDSANKAKQEGNATPVTPITTANTKVPAYNYNERLEQYTISQNVNSDWQATEAIGYMQNDYAGSYAYYEQYYQPQGQQQWNVQDPNPAQYQSQPQYHEPEQQWKAGQQAQPYQQIEQPEIGRANLEVSDTQQSNLKMFEGGNAGRGGYNRNFNKDYMNYGHKRKRDLREDSTTDDNETTTTIRIITRKRRTSPFLISLEENCDYIAFYCLKAFDTGTICARTMNNEYTTFKNYCMLDFVNCMERYEFWQIMHMGRCFHMVPFPDDVMDQEINEYNIPMAQINKFYVDDDF